MASVRLVNVTKKYGSKIALDNLNLEVKDKEFVVLAAPPGNGKSTLLRVIAGLEEPDSGEIYIGDKLVNGIPPKERDVSMVFENLALFPNKTGYNNIAFPLRQRKMPEEEIRKRVMDISKMLLIDHILDRLPQTFSGGEMQRVALARAMIRQPKVYLMDQPLANLDALIRANMRAEMKRLVKDIGQTIIFVTHDQTEALSMGDRIGIMRTGKILQLAPPELLYHAPANRYVATFIGTRHLSLNMNFIDCTYEKKDGHAALMHGKLHLDVTDMKDEIDKKTTGKEVILGVRPEHLHLSREHKHKEALEGKVYVTEPLGSKAIVTLKVPLEKDEIIRAVTSAEFKTHIGETLWLEIDKARMYLFDKRTEEAITTYA